MQLTDAKRVSMVVLVAVLGAACSGPASPPPHEPVPGPTPAVQRVPLGQLPQIDTDAVLAHTKVLASDDYEGRAPGSKGENLTINYLIEQFKQAGAKPGNEGGSYVQRVPLVGITTPGAPLVFKKGGQRLTLNWRDDVVAGTSRVADAVSIDDSETVFVGYGIVAPEFGWDDYKGLDVKGKTLVMLVSDPPMPDPQNPAELDPKLFGGKAMTYYGRWSYKYEIASAKGADAVLLVHETGPAGYGFDVVQGSWTGEQFELVPPDKNKDRVAIQGWITLEQAKKAFELGGHDFEALKKTAAAREFTPVPLGVTASMALQNKLRTVSSRNVLAKIEGADPQLKGQVIVYTAHWDHLGVGEPVGDDRIYNGAVDNAVGTAGLLEIARAFARLPAPPRRSILFIAVTAEEQGLLGSEYYAAAPAYPLAKTVAVINIDTINVHGRTRDVTVIGLGASELDEYVRDAAGEQGRIVKPDSEPEKGYYFRSDHFSFAKRGVPALNMDEGTDFIGKPPEYSQRVRTTYTDRHYHQPSDEVQSDWDMSGAREDLQVLFAVGYRVAEADAIPRWKPGNEFKARREAMLQTQ